MSAADYLLWLVFTDSFDLLLYLTITTAILFWLQANFAVIINDRQLL